MCRKLFLLISLILLLALGGNASADQLVDDFEQYTDTNDLRITWYTVFGPWGSGTYDRYLDPNQGDANSQAISFEGAAASGGFGGAVKRTLSPGQDWSAETHFRFWQKTIVGGVTDINDMVYRVVVRIGSSYFYETENYTPLPNSSTALSANGLFGGGVDGNYVELPLAGYGDANTAEGWYWNATAGGGPEPPDWSSGGIQKLQILTYSYSNGGSFNMLFDNYSAIAQGQFAMSPDPANNGEATDFSPTLSWIPGEYVDDTNGHQVYFGSSEDNVNTADVNDVTGIYRGQQDVNSYTVPETLELGTTYYWRVDEVNSSIPATYTGTVWSFLAAYHTVDSFNDYADTNDMNDIWTAGGSAVIALETAPVSGSDTPVIRVEYYNGSPSYDSWAYRMPEDTDWTVASIRALQVYFVGDAGNDPLPVYVEITDGTNTARVEHSDPNAALLTIWQTWLIDLADFTGVDLTSVTEVRIGVGDGATAGAGTVHFDGIRLYPSRCLDGAPGVDLNSDCTIDFRDFAVILGNWLGEQWF